MYPVIKGTAGFGGEITKKDPKHLLLEFNCLGIKGTEDVLLVIPSHNPNHKEIAIPFRKQCSTSILSSSSFIFSVYFSCTQRNWNINDWEFLSLNHDVRCNFNCLDYHSLAWYFCCFRTSHLL